MAGGGGTSSGGGKKAEQDVGKAEQGGYLWIKPDANKKQTEVEQKVEIEKYEKRMDFLSKSVLERSLQNRLWWIDKKINNKIFGVNTMISNPLQQDISISTVPAHIRALPLPIHNPRSPFQ